MSEDLLGLDDFYNPPTTTSSQSQAHHATDRVAVIHEDVVVTRQASSTLLDGFSQAQNNVPSNEDDDDFGEFETAQSSTAEKRLRGSSAAPSLENYAKDARSTHRPSNQRPKAPRDSNVLFDAEDEEPSDGDDFGDFEETVQSAKAAAAMQTVSKTQLTPVAQPNLIDIDGPIELAQPDHFKAATPRATAPLSKDNERGSVDQRNTKPPETFNAPNSVAARPKKAFASPSEPEWDDFEPASLPVTSSQSSQPDLLSEDATGEPTPPETASLPFQIEALLVDAIPTSPQTNLPPPAVLLSIFPTITEKAKTRFFEPLAQAASDEHALHTAYTNSQVREYLVQLLALSDVLIRIIAGRKSRWKRDAILAQSMRISQASAGGRSGGMKLAGLDKAENAREERDVADAVRAWRGMMGRLRSAVNAAGSPGAVPEIKEDYVVRMATEKEGAVTAPKQCVLCGLKRNERIVKLDRGVQDSFGEWWVDHWGHKNCARFWETYERSLKGR